MRRLTDMSLPNIGKLIGRDHSTVKASEDLIQKKYREDPNFSHEIEDIKSEIVGSGKPMLENLDKTAGNAEFL